MKKKNYQLKLRNEGQPMNYIELVHGTEMFAIKRAALMQDQISSALFQGVISVAVVEIAEDAKSDREVIVIE